jgi:prepilin-type N-terminal cleavage/methylation domain-containing protein
MKARRGLTLIELVVTLVVASLAMAAGYAALSTMVDRREHALQQFDRVAAAAELRKTLEQWIGAAELTIEEDDVVFRGLDGDHQGVPDDVLVLRTNALTAATEPGSTVTIFVDRNDSTATSGLVAVIRPNGASVSRTLQLDSQVASLDVRYLSSQLGVPEWGTSWVSSTLLPVAAELRLSSTHADSLEGLLRIPILIPIRVQ